MNGFIHVIMCFVVITSSASAAQPGQIPGRYIVQLKSTANPRSIISANALAPKYVYRSAMNGFAATIPPGKLKSIQKNPDVLSVIPDRVVRAVGTAINPRNPGRPQGQVIPPGIAKVGALPNESIYTGSGVGVAVLDTGLDFNHADLPIDAAHSFTVFGGSAQDDHGHGTHVAGIIAAKDNTIDVVGVAPGAIVYAVKVLDFTGTGSDASVIAGLDWIAAHAATLTPPIRIVNVSLGRNGSLDDDPAFRTAIQNLYNAGIVVVVAAGNDPSIEVTQRVPAGYPEVFAVASSVGCMDGRSRGLRKDVYADCASYFTTDGAFSWQTRIGITISAPGDEREEINRAGEIMPTGILSTCLGGGTTRMCGTSMAAPHVCGVIARYSEAAPELRDIELLRSLIREYSTAPNVAPMDSPSPTYTFDGDREGIVLTPDRWSILVD